MEYRGPNLQNIRLLVCPQCYDKPNEQLKPRILPNDPDSIRNPRPEYYNIDNNEYIGTELGFILATENGDLFLTWNPSNG